MSSPQSLNTSLQSLIPNSNAGYDDSLIQQDEFSVVEGDEFGADDDGDDEAQLLIQDPIGSSKRDDAIFADQDLEIQMHSWIASLP